MTKPFRTFEDLDNRLSELGYTERTMAQIRPESVGRRRSTGRP